MSKPAQGAAVTSRAEARTLAQRERILEAAQQCFIDRGFHAAGMAAIAESAGMSQGLIYRYFKGKNAIIVAIIERQLKLLRDEIAMLDGDVDLAARLAQGYGGCAAGGSRGLSPALILEMSAEATRDPRIAGALADFDAALRAEIGEWLRRAGGAVASNTGRSGVPGKALILQCLIDGLKVRRTREPGLDKEFLEDALAQVLPVLLSDGADG